MKHPNPFPAGPVMMASGVALLIITAILTTDLPWLCVFLGLAGIALLFAGLRILSGPAHILCPRCQEKNYIRNRARRTMVTDGVLTCRKCGAMLRRDL